MAILLSAMKPAWHLISAAGLAPACVLTAAATQVPADAGPSLWDVDISMTGTQCVIDPGHIRLWRAEADMAERLRAYGPANSPSTIVHFDPGSTTTDFDTAAFPILDGSSMTISVTSSGEAIGQIDFAIVEVDANDQKQLAEALKLRGCMRQLERIDLSNTR